MQVSSGRDSVHVFHYSNISTLSWHVSSLQVQATTRPHQLWPEIWSSMSTVAQRKEKQQWAIEKPKLDNARKLRGIYSIDPDDGEFQETIQNAKKKLEIPMEATISCKLKTTKCSHRHREIESGSNKNPKIRACMLRRSSRVYEKASVTDSFKRSRRSHCGEWTKNGRSSESCQLGR